MAFKRLTPETEKMFMASFNAAIDRYRESLSRLKADRLELPNENLDTGELTAAGKYKLTDAAYARLLDKLKDHYTEVPQALRGDILRFYRNLDVAISTKIDDNDLAKLLKELDQLKAVKLDLAAQRYPR